MTGKEFSEKIETEFESFVPAKVAVQFNVLDEMHANENAHTRILARLLQEPAVCRSFIRYVGGTRPDLTARLVDGLEKEFSVMCCSEYIDARIEYADKVIIIENKVKNAVDQDRQIDRYVQQALLEHRPENIYVIYLTRDGEKKVADYSFDESKKILGFEDEANPGRFISLNYKEHIVDWLERHLTFSIEELQNQPYLRSGIQQYLHYIKGPELLNERPAINPYGEFLLALKDEIRDVGLDVAIEALSFLYKKSIVVASASVLRLVEILRSVIRAEAERGNLSIQYWDRIESEGWGEVNHAYWWRPSGFALQLIENFAGEHVVRALELFPHRGVDFSNVQRDRLDGMLLDHPYFTYWWNGRTVYKFPVETIAEAKVLAGKLWRIVFETNA